MRHTLDFPPSVQSSPAPIFFFCLVLFFGSVHAFVVLNICLHVCFPDYSKKDEIKSMGDVKSELQKKVSKTHMKRKYLSQLYQDQDPSELPIQTDEQLPDDSPVNRKLPLLCNFFEQHCVIVVTSLFLGGISDIPSSTSTPTRQ